ncbi:MAG: hypothetical protein ACK6AH_11830 [Gemmatimonadota bacterium]
MLPLLLVDREWFDTATGIAQMITALAIVAAVVFAAGTAWAIRAAARGVAKSLEGAQAELVPLLKQARAIADDVKGMTSAAAGEVTRLRGVVEHATGKAEAALEAAEARLRRLDAMAGIVQDEAEQAVVSVAAAVRGTTAAVRAFRGDPAPDDDEDAELADAFDDDVLPGDVDDAPPDDAPPDDAAERPRVRHRPRRR